MSLHRLIRLYPRAWRDRYGDEFAALLEQTDANWRVTIDVLRGAAREWARDLTRHADDRGLSVRRLYLRNMARALAAVLTAWGIVSLAWPVAGTLHSFGLTLYAAWVPLLKIGPMARAMLSGRFAFHEPAQWPVGRAELMFWLGFAFVVSVLECLSGLSRPDTSFPPNPATPSQAVGLLWPGLVMLFAVTRGSARDLAMYLQWRRRRWQAQTAGPLGLNRD